MFSKRKAPCSLAHLACAEKRQNKRVYTKLLTLALELQRHHLEKWSHSMLNCQFRLWCQKKAFFSLLTIENWKEKHYKYSINHMKALWKSLLIPSIRSFTSMANKLKKIISYLCCLWQALLAAYTASLVIFSLLIKSLFGCR